MVLVALVAGWSLVRAATWSSPLPETVIEAPSVAEVEAAAAAGQQAPRTAPQPAAPDKAEPTNWQAPLLPAAPQPPVALPPVAQPPSGPAFDQPLDRPLAAVTGAPARRAPVPPR